MTHSGMSGLVYGDYRDRDAMGIGTGVDTVQFPPPFPPLSTSDAFTAPTDSSIRDVAPPPETRKISDSVETIFGSLDRFGRSVVSISHLGIKGCLAYPYVVFCRQCQVYPYYPARPSILAPLNTSVVLYHLAQSQGVGALWRGWYRNLQSMLVKPLVEALLMKVFRSGTSFGTNRFQLKQAIVYLVRKGLLQVTTLLLAPYAVMEMVQHTTEKVHVTESRFEFNRPFFVPDRFRRIPFLYLLPPSIVHDMMTDLITMFVSPLIQRYQDPPDDALSVAMNSLWTSYLGSFVSDIVLYPLETILVRLYCQGMPVLVDNIKTGREVMFISTYYSGALDCVGEIWGTEGIWGFYKGFSSLLLRYAVHGMVLLVLWRLTLMIKATTSKEAIVVQRF